MTTNKVKRTTWLKDCLHFVTSRIVLTSLMVGLAVTIFPATTQATTMSPTRMELDADPGTTTYANIKIYNDEKAKRTYYLSAAKFETQGETGDPVFVPEERGELVSWFKFPDSVEVGGQQYKELAVQIDIPQDAKPGGYFAAVFASVVPPINNDPGAVSIQSDVGTLILFRVNGDFPKDDSIVEFNTKDKKHWYSKIPVEFYFRFRNAGADRAQPLGDITVKNIFGQVTKIIPANKGAGNVLPQSIRRFDSAWVTVGGDTDIEQHTGPVTYPTFKNFWSHVQYEWNNLAIGRYTANIKVTVNNDASRTHSEKVAFWVIPWHLIVTILGVIAAERLLCRIWRARKKLFKSKPTDNESK